MQPTLTPAEWEQFFDLMQRVVELPLPFAEKVELVKLKAEELCRDGDLEEFTSWPWADAGRQD